MFEEMPKITFQGLKSSREIRLYLDGVNIAKVVEGNVIPSNLIEVRNIISSSNRYAYLVDDPYEVQKVLDNYDEIQRMGYENWKQSLPAVRSLDQIVPNGTIPENSTNNNQFHRWFDELVPEELELVLRDRDLHKELQRRIRWPSTYHEWCMVCEVATFKEWGVSMSEIHRFRTKTEDLVWTVPNDIAEIGGQAGKHGGTGSGTFHLELRAIIQESNSVSDFNDQLKVLINRWNIKPSLLPEMIR